METNGVKTSLAKGAATFICGPASLPTKASRNNSR